MTARTALATAIAAAAAAVLAACGAEQAAPPAPAPPPAPAAEPAPAGGTAVVPEAPAGRSSQSATLSDGTALDYTIVVPSGYEAGSTVPVLLALPPGGQGQTEVDAGLDRYWAAEAERRGWVVVSPLAPGELFFEGAERAIPELLAAVAARYPPEGGRFHLAGVSNGGKSAFRIAANDPELFASLLVLPGFPDERDDAKLAGIAEQVAVTMYVGEDDRDWLDESRQAQADLEALGGRVSLTIVPGEGHIIESLSGAELYDVLDAVRAGRRYDGGPEPAAENRGPY
jgi:poly(3-hydroxybutyrate) depolymerase